MNKVEPRLKAALPTLSKNTKIYCYIIMTNLTIKNKDTNDSDQKKQRRKTLKNATPIRLDKNIVAQQMHPGLTLDTAIEDFKSLQKIDCNSTKLSVRNGVNFVDFFTMKHRLETRGKEGITFYELWDQRAHYKTKKYVKNIIDFYKRTGIIKTELRVFLRIYNLYFGAVNIFKPIVAMDIYCRYKPQSVLDMTMGWGGRLVGACALNVPRYTGIDLNTKLEKSYEEMVSILKQHSTTEINLHFKNALNVDYSKIDYDLVLTSPPYYNTEQYEGQKVMEKEKWNRDFYTPLFEKTWKHLKKGGHYCLNVPVEVYETVAIKVMGKANEVLPMTKSKRKADEKYKEYIYVWTKTA